MFNNYTCRHTFFFLFTHTNKAKGEGRKESVILTSVIGGPHIIEIMNKRILSSGLPASNRKRRKKKDMYS